MQDQPIDLEQILRLSFLKRWHIVNVNKNQSVAEHSFNVAFIARELLMRGWDEDQVAASESEVVMTALWHDVPEAVMGDIVPPTKKYLKATLGRDVFGEIEQKICPDAPGLGKPVSEMTEAIVRTADLLEAVRFLLLEGSGSRCREINIELAHILFSFVKGTNNKNLQQAFLSLWLQITRKEDPGYLRQATSYLERELEDSPGAVVDPVPRLKTRRYVK